MDKVTRDTFGLGPAFCTPHVAALIAHALGADELTVPQNVLSLQLFAISRLQQAPMRAPVQGLSLGSDCAISRPASSSGMRFGGLAREYDVTVQTHCCPALC